MVLNMDDTFKKINELYNKSGFIDKYGSDIWMAVIITLVFFCICAYYYVLNNLEPIKADWDNQKCSPAVLPFAGLINKGPNDSTLDFTSKNFTGCVQSILINIVGNVFQPIYYIMKNLTDTFSEALNSVNAIRSVFDKVRATVKDFSSETMGRTLNITMPIVQMLVGIKSMGAKMTGVLTGSLYTLFGSYLTIKSFFMVIIDLITTILVILAALIVTFLIISAIPLFGSWAIPVAITNIVIMMLILIPTVYIQIFMSNILDISPTILPGVPRCFTGDTLLDVYTNDCIIVKPMVAVKIGDVLSNNTIVTASMKFSAKGQSIYNLHGVRVTGEHRVLHHSLGWLKVKNHPDSVLLPNFSEPFVYCLGTNTKTFKLGEYLYSDWDDIDETVTNALLDNCVDYTTNSEIHKYLDNGFIDSTAIELIDNTTKFIEHIQINDYLANGEQVLGIIKIDATDLKGLYEYNVGGTIIYGYNINLCLEESPYKVVAKTALLTNSREKYLYQLLTNTGKFKVNGLMVHDYNYGIDKYLL